MRRTVAESVGSGGGEPPEARRAQVRGTRETRKETLEWSGKSSKTGQNAKVGERTQGAEKAGGQGGGSQGPATEWGSPKNASRFRLQAQEGRSLSRTTPGQKSDKPRTTPSRGRSEE